MSEHSQHETPDPTGQSTPPAGQPRPAGVPPVPPPPVPPATPPPMTGGPVGAPPPVPGGPPVYSLPRTNGLAIASLILGILWLYWIGSILALVFGYIARRQIDTSQGWQTGRGLATAGIVLGWVGVAVLVLMIFVGILVAIVSAIAGAGSNLGPTPGPDPFMFLSP